MVLETDTNYTLTTLRNMECYQLQLVEQPFPIIATTEAEVEELLPQYTHKDVILIDSAGKTTDTSIKQIALGCDAIIVPTSITQADLIVTYQTIEDLAPATRLNPKLQIVVLPNRIHTNTGAHTIRETFKTLNVTVITTFVAQKANYTQYSTLTPEESYLPTAQAIIKQLSIPIPIL